MELRDIKQNRNEGIYRKRIKSGINFNTQQSCRSRPVGVYTNLVVIEQLIRPNVFTNSLRPEKRRYTTHTHKQIN